MEEKKNGGKNMKINEKKIEKNIKKKTPKNYKLKARLHHECFTAVVFFWL